MPITQRQAKRNAQRLARRLGEGWRAEIWNNMGWHWKANYSGYVSVYPDSDNTDYADAKFRCALHNSGSGVGELAMYSPIPSLHSDPAEAVRRQLRGYTARMAEHLRNEAALLVHAYSSVPLKAERRPSVCGQGSAIAAVRTAAEALTACVNRYGKGDVCGVKS